MSQSLSAIYAHITFSTKKRQQFLHDKKQRQTLHAYLSGIIKTLDCQSLIVGGVADHVHILVRLNRTITPAGLIRELKRVSTRWLREQQKNLPDFEWQHGYAIFSVSQSNLQQVTNYIANQEHHHQTMCFQDELRTLLQKHNIVWDEQYLWN